MICICTIQQRAQPFCGLETRNVRFLLVVDAVNGTVHIYRHGRGADPSAPPPDTLLINVDMLGLEMSPLGSVACPPATEGLGPPPPKVDESTLLDALRLSVGSLTVEELEPSIIRLAPPAKADAPPMLIEMSPALDDALGA